MIPSDPRAASESPAAGAEDAEPRSARGTLPPPEWTAQQDRARRATLAPQPLERRAGIRAEEAWMRARVEEARAEGDPGAGRTACVALARWLASRDRDLDEAVDLAVDALRQGDDVELRRELASWLESLGEAARAAGTLRSIVAMPEIDPGEAAYLLVRTGVLKARAGAAAGAAAAFEAALPIAPQDPLPAELLGALSEWEPDAVPRAMAAEAYVEAARRRAAQEDGEAELEDLWRAFAMDGSSGGAVHALADALERRGKHDAADEVWREHARRTDAQDPERAAAVHARRRAVASAAHASARAFAAALDEGLDACFEGEGADAFDAILLDLGMLEAVAARRVVRGSGGDAADRAAHLVDLARLYGGPLADDARASATYFEALALDPANVEASAALRARYGEIPSASEVAHAQEDHGSDSRAAAAIEWVRALGAGDGRAEVASLERVASSAAASVRSVLLSSAAERSRMAGRSVAARRLAELAVQADPASPRAIATLADVVTEGEPDRSAAAALERAVTVVGPRATWCTALANALDVLGETELAVGWSQRVVALRPGHRPAIERLLERLARSTDGARLGDALGWLLSQPQPAAWLSVPFARALRDLASLDVDRGVVLARRALDVFGPKIEALREAMLDVAERASDAGFAAAVLERWAACGAEGTERSLLLVRLADLHERLGDDEGEARVVARAVQEGAVSPEIDRRLARLNERPLGPDAQLWRLRAHAERAAAAGDAALASWAWRELGGALWDLAEDRVGAIAAWQRAARMSESRGHATLALDLVAFAGVGFAFEYLARLIEAEPDDREAAAIAADVARAALTTGEPDLAFDLAARGLARSPTCADALAVAERAAERTREHPALSALYELVASRALGRFGRRAAHYRGARFFERRGEHAFALKHAAQAFYAVPSEGSAFQLLARAAERAGDRTHAVRTIEQVAEGTEHAGARAAWLLRAASIADESEEGMRHKVDVLLRAAVAYPSVATIALLKEAAEKLLAFEPDEREVLEIRLARAARAVTERSSGPEGARIAIALACALLDLFADADAAMTSIERAITCDADAAEFSELEGRAGKLALATDGRQRTAKLLDAAESPHANVGVPVLRLLALVAAAVGDDELRARASVAAALRQPDDDLLVSDADEAVRRVPALADRLAQGVPPRRRADALLAVARAHASEGTHAAAAPLFERAADLLDAGEREEVEGELRAAWDAAGRGSEIDERVQREAASHAASPAMRAERWMEIAERRETRGDKMGAVRALLEACKLDPQPMHRWSSLERVAEGAGDDDARVAALDQIAVRVGADGRVPVFKRLARAHERRGDFAAAAAAWARVLALDPDDEEADHSIESLIVARGRYDELADHLARRAERLTHRSGMREMLRAVRLRRAAILEQRLGRVPEACDELTVLLDEWPDSSGALRYLADLLDRQGQPVRSAPLWRKAAALEGDVDERNELELRAGRASLTAGDLQAATDHASGVLERNPASPAALGLRVDVARSLGADGDLGDALDALARRDGVDPRARSDLLLEAAQAAARAGDPELALERARRAAAFAQDRATPQLLVRGLEYRLRGAGGPDEARHTIEELTRIREPLGPDDDALRAFLLAEALDVVQGGGAGLHELEATQAVVGDHPLVALGLAERLLAMGQLEAAVDAYRAALAGSLLELRNPARVSLAAADAAVRALRLEDAAWFVAVAERYEETRVAAAERRTLLVDLGRMSRPSPQPEPDLPSVETARHGGGIVPGAPVEDLEAAVRAATTPGERARVRLALGRLRIDQGDPSGAEALLWEALAEGLAEAGDVLALVLASSPDRAPDVVRVRRQQVALEPGDIGRLEALRAAALADDDRVFARAVEHVLRAFDAGAGPLPPPPLAAQPEQPGIFAFLARPSMDAAGEALALLWEGAMQLFVRDTASYGITGVERVVPGSTSPIARLYETAMHALDAPRIPLFVPRASSGTPASYVALLTPPSVILAGDVREDSAELRFALGQGMCAALAHNVLRLGLPEVEGRAVVDAMRAAFGPPEMGRTVDARAARLAESFWQIVPARTQRRLQELLSSAAIADYDELVGRAYQSGRRVGLFLSGDFAGAARALLAEDGSRTGAPPSLLSLRSLCEQLPALADLLRLAVSPEYASARWQVVAQSAPRGTISSGRFSLF
jgi:tetratricopeptide (TPR) repeat protein